MNKIGSRCQFCSRFNEARHKSPGSGLPAARAKPQAGSASMRPGTNRRDRQCGGCGMASVTGCFNEARHEPPGSGRGEAEMRCDALRGFNEARHEIAGIGRWTASVAILRGMLQ